MADVQVKKAAAHAVIDDMVQANSTMTAALQDMLDRIRPLQASFSGNAAAAWTEFQTTVNMSVEKMNSTFGQGAQSLERMVDAQIGADHRAASQLAQ
ncbi:WXG100 family type VII secretion target [Streptomyces sp. NPDC056796]|uniref:WXG100 family type VII secretion target n=1 Tax=unclassified Streptomyces TaxID=2593676 RepID=UPI003692018A